MINDVIIIDDVIGTPYQNELERVFLGEMQIPWYLLNDVSLPTHTKEKNAGFVHTVFEETRGGITSNYYNLVLPLVLESIKHIPEFKYQGVYRGRSFLQLPATTTTPNNVHTDISEDQLVVLSYVNDSNGDTIIYNETDKQIPMLPGIDRNDLTEKMRVTPKKGRVVMFNGHHYHCSSSPSIDKRCIINFDLYGEINATR